MTSQNLLFPAGKNDECYTPAYFVELILPYIPAGAVVWCPFDTEESEFVKLISKTNKVIYSHKDEGKDFLLWQPEEHWDVAISNPHFTKKRETIVRMLSFGKPFALAMTASWLNDAAPVDVFWEAERDMQLILTNKRVDYQGKKKIVFMSLYICSDLLPRDIVLAPLKSTKPKKYKP